jgi:hypothetical protein
MDASLLRPATAFEGHHRLKSGPLHLVALAAKRALGRGAAGPVLVFDDANGQVIEVDDHGSAEQLLARLAARAGRGEAAADEPRGRGRPKLGVIAREVTLLPRHWAWLGAQPGGASVALRKLVDDARRTGAGRERVRRRQDATYAFLSVMAGDLPGFEEAARALYAADGARFKDCVSRWPRDVARHAIALGFGEEPRDVAG